MLWQDEGSTWLKSKHWEVRNAKLSEGGNAKIKREFEEIDEGIDEG
jgi:hypothetical protein